MTCVENGRNVHAMQRDEIIAHKVHERTARPSINLTGLAHSLGITRQKLRRRLDHGGWKYDELEALAQALDMTVDQLVSDENGTTVSPAP